MAKERFAEEFRVEAASQVLIYPLALLIFKLHD
jgi:hypothetical protein